MGVWVLNLGSLQEQTYINLTTKPAPFVLLVLLPLSPQSDKFASSHALNGSD